VYSINTLIPYEIFLDFNAKVCREDIFKPTTGNESLHDIRNDNGARAVNFATSKNLTIRDLYREINYFKRGYQLRSNFVKDENGDLLADPLSILNRWRNYCSQLLNVDRASDVRQIEIYIQLSR
jgi:hypothetical protein